MFRTVRLLVFLVCVSLVAAAEEFKAVVNDVVTSKVVSVTILSGTAPSGTKLIARRDGKDVGILRLRTASGICRVLSGSVKTGDLVVVASRKERVIDETKASSTSDETARKSYLFTGKDVVEKRLCQAEGGLLYAERLLDKVDSKKRDAAKALVDEVGDLLSRVRIAKILMTGGTSSERVALALHDLGQAALADRIAKPKKVEGTAPILPAQAKHVLVYPYGEMPVLSSNLADWQTPSYWGEKPIPPNFNGWQFDATNDVIQPGEDALIRRNLSVTDMTVSGDVNVRSGRALYLILRSQVVVKFNHEFATSGVSYKSGYDNLSQSTSQSDVPILERDRWYSFSIRLKGDDLSIDLDGKNVLTSVVSLKRPVKPGEAYLGLGAYKGRGSFRKLRIKAIGTRSRRALPVFVTETEMVDDGTPITMLEDGKKFASLYGTRVRDHRTIHHAVKDGILSFSGSPYYQFTLEELTADAYRVTGTMRIMEEGNVWFRLNPNLLLGVGAVRKGTERDADEPAFYLKRRLGNYLNYEQGFKGTPLVPKQWYEWCVDYRHPCVSLAINGRVVAMACMEEGVARVAGFNHFGINAYNVKVDVKGMTFQRMKPKRPSSTIQDVTSVLVTVRKDVEYAINELKMRREASAATAVLQGKRKPVAADADEFIDVAKTFRAANDWGTYLELLERNYKRFPVDSDERTKNETVWRVAQETFDLVQETMEPGDLGLDGIIALTRKRIAISMAFTGGVWFHLPGKNILVCLDPERREIVKKVPFTDGPVQGVVDRGTYLIVLCNEGRRFLKVTMDTMPGTKDLPGGSVTARANLPTGSVVDWTSTRSAFGYFSVNENKVGEIIFAKFSVYRLAEKTMTIRKTDAFGQTLAVDPHGRYLYSGISVELNRALGRMDPAPVRPQPIGARIDHLLCFQIAGDELSLLSQRAAPGLEGVGLVASPTGRGVSYVAKRGFPKDRRRELTGMKVPIFRAGRVNQTVASLDCGGRPALMAFNPVRSEAYVYNGRELVTFELNRHQRITTFPLPAKCVTGSGTDLKVDVRGNRLYFAYSGNPGGIVVFDLTSQGGGPSVKSPSQLVAEAQALIDVGRVEDAKPKLKAVALDSAFSPVGEKAAMLWLTLKTIDLKSKPPPSLGGSPLSVYRETEPPKEIVTPKRAAAPAHRPAIADTKRVELEELNSFRNLAKRYPASWYALCLNAMANSPNDPEILLLLAESSLDVEKPHMAHRYAQRLLKAVGDKGYYAVRAYGVLAKASTTRPDRIHAWSKAQTLAPRNPFIHRRLGKAFDEAKLKTLATYHVRMSLHLFPSQPKLWASLEAAGAVVKVKISPERDIAELYKVLSPSTVLVRHKMGVGTGFFITRDGLLLTNDHVVAGNAGSDLKVHVVEPDGKKHELPAIIVARDSHLDIAILSVDLGELTIEPMVLAPHDLAKTGMRTIAIGNPGMGAAVLAQTVTEGIISNVRQRVDGQFYVQTSAAVNPGNSGGPLISRHGLVLGMVTLKASLDNVGFAIPAKRLVEFLEKALD